MKSANIGCESEKKTHKNTYILIHSPTKISDTKEEKEDTCHNKDANYAFVMAATTELTAILRHISTYHA